MSGSLLFVATLLAAAPAEPSSTRSLVPSQLEREASLSKLASPDARIRNDGAELALQAAPGDTRDEATAGAKQQP